MLYLDDAVLGDDLIGRSVDQPSFSMPGPPRASPWPVIEPGDRGRLVEVWDTPVDVEPTDHMAFFRYEDRPGVIGAVGTGFGEAGVNIAAAQVGRRTLG